MGSIPLPALSIQGPAPEHNYTDALAEYARVAGLKAQTAQTNLQNQQMQQTMRDNDAQTKALHTWDGKDLTGLLESARRNGISAPGYLALQKNLIDTKTNLNKLSDEDFLRQQKISDLTQGVHDQVTQASPEQKQDVYTRGLETLQKAGADVSKEPLQYPGDAVFAQHLPVIRLHSAVLAESQKDREISAQEQTAQAKEDAATKPTAEEQNFQSYYKTKLAAQGLAPSAAEELKARDEFRTQSHPQAVDQAEMRDWIAKHPGKGPAEFMAAKAALAPTITYNLQAAGTPATGAAAASAKGESNPKNLQAAVPANIKPTVLAIVEGRQTAPSSFALKTPYWQNVMNQVYALDPQWNEQRAQLRKSYTIGPQSKEINAINTAMGHVGVLGDAIDALSNNDVRLLNKVANRLGVEVGNTPVTTFNTIVHRVGPELSKAYIGAGGSAGERGSDEKDFDPNLGPGQLKANVAITAQLLRSKISSLENQWDQNAAPGVESFQERFIMPEAKRQLDKWSPESGGAKQGGGAAKEIHYKIVNGQLVAQ